MEWIMRRSFEFLLFIWLFTGWEQLSVQSCFISEKHFWQKNHFYFFIFKQLVLCLWFLSPNEIKSSHTLMDLFRIYYFNSFDFFTCLLWDFKWTVIIITSVSVRAEECAVEWRYVPVTNHSKLQTKSLLLCECTESLRRGWGGQRGDVREEEMEEEKSFFPLKCESTEPEAQQARSSPWWSVTELHYSGYFCTAPTKKINLTVPALIHQWVELKGL